jgi:cytochrome c biogenesis protein CcmG/thiol:disulfide interchange protein DsbE
VRRRLLLAGGVIVVAAALVIGILVARDTGPATGTPSASTERLSLAGTDPVTGKPVSLERFSGKPVLVNVWASWCPGCHEEAREILAFRRAHPEVAVIGINFQDSTNGAKRFAARYDWTIPSISDRDGRLAFSFGLQGMPTTLLLGADHREVARFVGATTRGKLEEALARLEG